jgi:hypothetical protein
VKVRIKLLEEMLGTASADPEIHEKFIASKSADKDKIKEEMANTPSDELVDKAMTVFPRSVRGNPIVYDYQVKGFIKEAFGVQVEFGDFKIKVGRKEYKVSKWTYKRIVDNFIFVSPRSIKPVFPDGTEMGLCTRPLRADTQKGARVALATSETIPAGTVMEFEVNCLQGELLENVCSCLDYGALKGLGQWRNSGKGRFEWEEI